MIDPNMVGVPGLHQLFAKNNVDASIVRAVLTSRDVRLVGFVTVMPLQVLLTRTRVG